MRNLSRKMCFADVTQHLKLQQAKVEIETNFFDALCALGSQKLLLDFPVCKDCYKDFYRRVEQEFEEKHSQLESLEKYAASLIEAEAPAATPVVSKATKPANQNDKQLQALKREFEDLASQEAELARELEQLQSERSALVQQEDETHEMERKINSDLAGFWHEHSLVMSNINNFENERDSLFCSIRAYENYVEVLNCTNSFNETFFIWFDGFFGTINNLRIGKLPIAPVDWNEINTGLFFAANLLKALADVKGYTFTKNNIVLKSANAKLVAANGYTTQELQGPGSTPIFGQSSFDKALIAFLGCLDEFARFAAQSDASFDMPYRIESDKVGGMSVKHSSGDENWTRAMKYFLTNLKCLAAWVSRTLPSQDKQQQQQGDKQ